jgi:uncharacterized membrane protein
MKLDRRHVPFLVALAAGAAALAVLLLLGFRLAVGGAATVFFLVYLVMTGMRIPRLTARYLKENAARTDEPAPVIFAVTLLAVVAAVAALFMLVNSKQASSGIELALSLATVGLGWFTIHVMAALHYAHLFWRPEDAEPAKRNRGGLEFPGGTQPGANDFLYFAFVTGMTAQTSDVAITSTAMRKFNLLHGIVSFFFNTVLVAAAVNVAVSFAD